MTDDLDDQCRFEADDLVDHFHFGALVYGENTGSIREAPEKRQKKTHDFS